MPHKKQKASAPASEQDQLIERIDAMMDIKRPDAPTVAKNTKADEPIDIFKDMNTAPPVSTVADTDVTKPEPKPEPVAPPKEEAPLIIKHQPVVPPQPVQKPKVVVGPLPKPPQTHDSLADPKTDKAVDEITKSEGDAYFEARDAADRTAPLIKKQGISARIKKLFR